jgi:serine/threonine protein kinase
MPTNKVIGEGTYGCVHKPSLTCQNTPTDLNYHNKISKVLAIDEANNELKEFKNIKKIDKQTLFHSGTPYQCGPDDTAQQRAAIKKCKNSTFKYAVKHSNGLSRFLSLLIMDNGGVDLRQFISKLHKKSVTPANIKCVEEFFIEFERAFVGLLELENAGYVHNDLKLDNLVYNADTRRLNFIDFGLTHTHSSIKRKGHANNYYIGDKCHWSFPPDILFIQKEKHKSLTIAMSKKNNPSDLVTKFFFKDGYGHRNLDWVRYFLTDMYPDLTSDEINVFKQKRLNDLYKSCKFISEFSITHNISIYTIDSYGIGMALSYASRMLKSFIPNDTYDQLNLLSETMTHWNINQRKKCSELLTEYQNILYNTGILGKHDMQISIDDNPRIVKLPKTDVTNNKVIIKKIPSKKIRIDAIKPPTPIPNVKRTTVKKTSSSKRKTRKSDNYSTNKAWKGQQLRDRLFSLQKQPEKKGNGNSGKFNNLKKLKDEIRKLENEQGKSPKLNP